MKKRLLALVALSFLALLGVALATTATGAPVTWADGPCFPVNAVNVCPDGAVGQTYNVQLLGRDGSGCWPFDTFSVLSGAPPPGITLAAGGLLSGTPTQAGTYVFYVNMHDFAGPSDTWCLPKDYQRQLSISVAAAAPTTTATITTPPLLPYYWHLTSGSTILHSERAITYTDGTTGLGNMLRWETANKDAIRAGAPVTLTHLRASS